MANLSQGESCTIPAGEDNATVTNTDPNRNGSYDLVIEGSSANHQIAAGATQNTAIHRNEAVVTNTGKAVLSVDNCNG